MSATKILWGQVIAVLLIVLASIWSATQWTAAALAYQPELGSPWFLLGDWPVYPPPAFFWWWFAFDAYAPEIFRTGAYIAVSGGFAAIVVAIGMSIWRAREARNAETYGSARWATMGEARTAGLLRDEGVVLGRLGSVYLRHDGPEHVLCFAPTRSGKGVGLVVPSLLTWPGSAIVHDIKGENWQLTAGFRAHHGRVLLFDPTNAASAAYNPLLEIRKGAWEVRDVQNVADVLVDPEGSLEKRNHWEKTSHALLVGAILHVLYAGEDKTLAGVAAFLSDPRQPIESTLRAMMTTPHLGEAGVHPVVASAARELLNKSANERSGVLSTAMSFLGLYRDPVVAQVTRSCEWRIADLVESDVPITLYLVVPPIGTRQYGVDVAALSTPDSEGKRKLYLFSLKQGDLTRADWDGTPQALRSSINEIIDVYIPTRVARAYRKYDVVICLCFGGDVQEAVRDNLTMFTNELTREALSFEEWNGDYLAGLLVDGVLREQLVSPELRTHFQKAVAMVDEPEVAFTHFAALIRGICATTGTTPRQRTTILRQLSICLWVFFVWARDTGNIEAPYRASERALLHAWQLVRDDITRTSKASEAIGIAYADLVDLHCTIWDGLLGEKILPFVGKQHAISVAVNSAASADVNLKLFETLGRVAMRGLWHLWFKAGPAQLPELRSDWESPEATELAQQIVLLIRNNPILLTPITDEQVVDIGVALLFLSMLEQWNPAACNYAEALIERITLAYRTHNRYPTIHSDYRTLIDHPHERTDEFRQAQTKGSTLFPLLALWAASLGGAKGSAHLAQFAARFLGHCNAQFWIADGDTEERFYVGDTQHGASLGGLPITEDGAELMRILETECSPSSSFLQLSAIRLGHWPILALACRHYRLPLPPDLWLGLVKQLRAKNGLGDGGPIRKTKRKRRARSKTATKARKPRGGSK